MARATAATLLLALTVRPADAQQIGLTVGRTNADVHTGLGDGSSSYPDRHAITVGVTYRRPVLPSVGFQPELLLVQRGWITSEPTLSLTYLEVPLLLRVGALAPGRTGVRPVLTIGPALSILARCSLAGVNAVRVEGDGCNQRIVLPFEEDYRVSRFDVGAVLGVGAEAGLRNGTVVGTEGRFELGLTDIRPGYPGKSRNSTFFLLLNVAPGRSRRPPAS